MLISVPWTKIVWVWNKTKGNNYFLRDKILKWRPNYYSLNSLYFCRLVVNQYRFSSHTLNVIKRYNMFPLVIGITTAAVVVVRKDTHYLYLFPRAIAVRSEVCVCACVCVRQLGPAQAPAICQTLLSCTAMTSLPFESKQLSLEGDQEVMTSPTASPRFPEPPRSSRAEDTQSQNGLGTGADPREWGFPSLEPHCPPWPAFSDQITPLYVKHTYWICCDCRRDVEGEVVWFEGVMW